MHTIKHSTSDYGTVRIHYNSDWSGDVLISWQEGDKRKEIEMPGAVMLAIRNRATIERIKSELIEYIENKLKGD